MIIQLSLNRIPCLNSFFFCRKSSNLPIFFDTLVKDKLKTKTILLMILIKIYGGKDKAVEASLSATGSMEEVQKFQKETDEIYKGDWLKAAGFNSGDYVNVICEDGKLTILLKTIC